jgi:hypothetical protein
MGYRAEVKTKIRIKMKIKMKMRKLIGWCIW